MVAKKALLKIAERLAECRYEGVIQKVCQIAQGVYDKGLRPAEAQKEFLTMMKLYNDKRSILSGGQTVQDQFKDFSSRWLRVKCGNTPVAVWDNRILEGLQMDELIYVLGWAARLAKYKKEKN